MGCATLNSSRVYAAYDYDAQEEDEISVRLGESITVVDREHQGEKAWWLCTSTRGDTGFLPRNYLCLYPRRVVPSPTTSTGGETGGDGVEQLDVDGSIRRRHIYTRLLWQWNNLPKCMFSIDVVDTRTQFYELLIFWNIYAFLNEFLKASSVLMEDNLF